MKISLAWLNEHINLESLDLSIDELSDLLTFAGIEVEGISGLANAPDNVVVGKMLESKKHPNADRLSVCQVSVSNADEEPLQIVCGAKNYQIGDYVCVALPGAKLGDFEIKESQLRGVESKGMMCSGAELGISADSDGLLILQGNPTLGALLGDEFKLETVFELEITPNRSDLLSHLGIAREISALTETPLIGKNDFGIVNTDSKEASPEEISIAEDCNCKFYSRRIISGVAIKDSESWLKTRLASIGLKPINNVVDITNYVLHDMGQPLHAFDLDKISGGLQIRLANKGEKILALDEKTYELTPDDIVIADAEKILAIAGVIGGLESAVNENTENILLESAYFQPQNIRRTSARLAVSTDSSYRFERGVDDKQVLGASELATELIVKQAGGKAEEFIHTAGQVSSEEKFVKLEHEKAINLICKDITDGEITNILTRFNFKQKTNGDDGNSSDDNSANKTQAGRVSHWQIPSYRKDISRHIDLVEEISRYYGTEKVNSSNNLIFSEHSEQDWNYDSSIHTKQRLSDFGFFEVQSLKLISENALSDAVFLSSKEQKSLVNLENPLSVEYSFMTPSLIPGLLTCAEKNLRNGIEIIKLMEISSTFFKFGKNYVEKEVLALLVTGKAEPPSYLQPRVPSVDIYYLKGVLQTIFANEEIKFKQGEGNKSLAYSIDVVLNGKSIGKLGQISDKRAKELGATEPIFVAEILMSAIYKNAQKLCKFQPFARFPEIQRDIALEIGENVRYEHLDKFFSEQKKSQLLIESYKLFDVFQDSSGKKLAKDKRSLAFSITYRCAERTLTSEEVDKVHNSLREKLLSSLSVKIR